MRDALYGLVDEGTTHAHCSSICSRNRFCEHAYALVPCPSRQAHCTALQSRLHNAHEPRLVSDFSVQIDFHLRINICVCSLRGPSWEGDLLKRPERTRAKRTDAYLSLPTLGLRLLGLGFKTHQLIAGRDVAEVHHDGHLHTQPVRSITRSHLALLLAVERGG